jgi:dimethylglycine dehydrogenase
VLLNENHPAPAPGEPIREKWSFRRSNYFDFVGDEVKNVHDNVGIQDMSAFAKAWVTGPGAEAWLDSILANRIPKKVGRIHLCHLLSANGGVRSEFTVYRSEAERLLSRLRRRLGAPRPRHAAEASPRRRLGAVLSGHHAWGVLVVAGPNSRALLQKLTDTDLSNEAFPWLTGKRIDIGAPTPTRFASISSASSAGNCITRSRCRTPSSTS